MKRKYISIIMVVLMMAFIVTFSMIGCKKVTVTPATTAETTTATTVETPTETTAAETTTATTTTAAETTTATTAVSIKSNAFNPASLTIKVGDTVTWTNNDSYAHTVTSDNGAFDSGSMAGGATFSFTFSTAGTYNYICSIHTSMTAKIIVQ